MHASWFYSALSFTRQRWRAVETIYHGRDGGELPGPDSSESLHHLPSLPAHPPGALSLFSAASLTHQFSSQTTLGGHCLFWVQEAMPIAL